MNLVQESVGVTSASPNRAGSWLCLAGAALGALGLFGWIGGVSVATTIVPGLPPMMPATALGLALIGGAGAGHQRQSAGPWIQTLSLLATLVVLAVGVTTLAEYGLGIDIPIYQLLVRGQTPIAPGPPSLLSALALTSLAVAILVLDVRPAARITASERFVMFAALTAFMGLTGIVLGATPLFRSTRNPIVGLSLPTAVSLLLTSLGLLLARPTSGFMGVATSSGPGGTLLRRLALPIILGPVLLGLLVTRVSAAQEIVSVSIPVAILAAAMTGISFFLLVVAARPINRAHDELDASRTLSRNLIEQASDGIFVADADGRYTDVNSAGCRLLGYPRDEIIGRTVLDFIPPHDRERFERSRQLLLEGATEVAEWTLRRQDGSYVPVEVSAKILPDGRMQGLVRDISERRRLEAALRASLADLVRAQSVTDVGSWKLDVRNNLFQWSEQEYEIFGVTRGTSMTYETFLACVHPDDRAYVDREWSATLRGAPYDIEHRIVANGEIRWVREKADLEFDEDHNLVGGIGITLHITERREREERLRQTEERLDLALRGADLALWDWNVVSGDVIFNQRWAEMRGYLPAEVRGHVDSWITGVHPDDRPGLGQTLDDYLHGRRPDYEAEYRVRTKSGQWIWVLDRGKVFERNEQGAPVRMLGTELDITPRKQAEEALRLAEAKAAGIVSISADAIISMDDQQRITLFNEGAERIFGYSKAEAIGQPVDILVPERLRGGHRQHVAGFAASPEASRRMGTQDAVIVGRRRNGEEFPAEAAISKLTVGGTQVLTVIVRDITLQKQIENEQRFLAEIGSTLADTLDYEATLSSVAEIAVRNLSDFCVVDFIDEQGELRRLRVVSRDPDATWICDILRQHPIDRQRPHVIHSALASKLPLLIRRLSPADIDALAESDEHLRALRAMNPQSVMVAPLVAHGHLLGAISLLSTSASRVYGGEDLRVANELAQRAALAVDNARLYRSVQRAVQVRDEVLGVVAHDLRNPLSAIVMQAWRLRRHEPGNEAVEAIERAATRMKRLIQDLLDVTQMEAGQLAIEQTQVPVAQLVSDTVESQRELASSGSLGLHLDVAQDLPDVWGDRDRLLQVFENLIGNAIKFTPAGGSITIGARARAATVLFSVSDTGVGIPVDDQPHLFERFWQGRQAKQHGAGLGLPIVRGLVEAHGGRIWVESAPERGSSFHFTIPTAQRNAERADGGRPVCTPETNGDLA